MHDVEQKLMKCFSAVFPELSPEEIVNPTLSTTGAVDSLTAVTLMALVQEEFGIELDPDGALENLSFANMLTQVAKAMESQIPAESAHG